MATARKSNSDSSTSTSLLRRVREHDAGAWQRLVDLYGPLVFYWGRRSGLRPPDAADVMQDVFAAVHGAIGRFERDPHGGTFRGWLWTIARNKIHDHFRRAAGQAAAAGGTDAARRLDQVPESWDDESADPRDRGALSGLYRRALEFVRSEFEERTWQAFWRSVVEDEPAAEIAADLGISANAVRQYKSRVLRRLRQELGDLDG
ncbi:MAG TPA: sigma-70 family RNA polymerase sigma factor [Planctomycetaceae bacterium]|nr:sigma-70 family RNA polymerase sigma factor [Planctomycetaceae bacterium]